MGLKGSDFSANERNLRDVRGGTRRADFQWTEPVARLVEGVHRYNFVSPDAKFVFLGRAMRPHKTFAEYRLEDGSTIDITL